MMVQLQALSQKIAIIAYGPVTGQFGPQTMSSPKTDGLPGRAGLFPSSPAPSRASFPPPQPRRGVPRPLPLAPAGSRELRCLRCLRCSRWAHTASQSSAQGPCVSAVETPVSFCTHMEPGTWRGARKTDAFLSTTGCFFGCVFSGSM